MSRRAFSGSRPLIAEAIVDLPEPDSPTSAVVLPVGTSKDASNTVGTIRPPLA